MVKSIRNQLLQRINEVANLYYRLILVVAPSGSGKTEVLRELSETLDVPVVNLNLELSRCMLDLTDSQRAFQLPDLLDDILNKDDSEIVLLDNIEMLFHPTLKQDPIRLLQGRSRNKTIAVAWNGDVKNNNIYYAEPEHPEYKRYPVSDFLVVSPTVSSNEDNDKVLGG